MLSNKSALSIKAALLVICLVILAVLFAQSAASAKDGNVSISGITFLDVNSNGKLDSSEPPLQNYTIYIDANSNSIYDPGENAKRTDVNGKYSFNNITPSGIVRASRGDQFQPSFPREGYDLTEVTARENKLNFSYSIPNAADSMPLNYLLILMALLAFAIILGGGIVLISGLLRFNKPSNGDSNKDNVAVKSSAKKDKEKDKKSIMQIVSGLILLLLGLYLLISLVQMLSNAIYGTAVEMSSPYALVAPAVLALLLFGAILLMLHTHFKLKGSEPGEMRKTIAGLLVLGLVAVVFYALNGNIQQGGNQEIVTQYIQLVGIVIAFYFGSKASSDAYKKTEEEGSAQEDLDVENVTYDGKGNIQIKLSNSKGLDFQLDKVVIKDGAETLIDKSVTRFGSEAFKDIVVPIKLDELEKKKLEESLVSDKVYDITIKTKSIGDYSCKRKISTNAGSSNAASSSEGSTNAGSTNAAPSSEGSTNATSSNATSSNATSSNATSSNATSSNVASSSEVSKNAASSDTGSTNAVSTNISSSNIDAAENTIDPKIVRKGFELISVLWNSYSADQSAAKFAAEKVKAETALSNASAEKETAEVAFSVASGEKEKAEAAFSNASAEKEKAEAAFSVASSEKEKAETAFSNASAEKEKAEKAMANAADENALSLAKAEKLRAETALSEATAEKVKADNALAEAAAERVKAETALTEAIAVKVKAETVLTEAIAEKARVETAFTAASAEKEKAENALALAAAKKIAANEAFANGISGIVVPDKAKTEDTDEAAG